MNMKHRLMIACLCSLPVGVSILTARLASAAAFQTHQSTNQSEDVRTLAPGAPVEREMSGGQRHLYQLTLETNQCLKIVAEQRGADVSLTLNGPNGKPFDTVENNRGGKGVEWLLWQAQTAGNYQLEVKSRGNNAAGIYRIEVETFAAQGDALPAFRNYLEARRLALQRKPELADQMLRLQEESLAAWQRLNRPQVEGLMLLLIAANNHGRDGRKSLAYYQRALPIFQSLGMKAEEARALNAAGLMSMSFGNYRDSRRYFEQAMSLADYFQPNVVTMIVGNLGSSYFNIGESQKGMEYHLRSLAASRAANDQMSVLVALEKLSQQCHLMGESAKSLGYVNEGLSLARELKSSGSHPAQRRLSASEGILLGVLGNLHRDAGDYEKAVEILQQSIALHREAGNAVNAANRTLDLGNLYLSQGKAQLALELFSQALTSLQKASEISAEAHAQSMIGRAHTDLGDYQQALDALTRALAIIRANEIRSEEWPTLINLAEVAERMGDGRKAGALLDEALSVSSKMAAPEGAAAALTRLARLARKGGDFNQARQFFEASLRVSEERRFRFGLRRLKDSFGAGEQNLYEEFIGLLMQLHEANPQAGNDRIAFETSERARARGLLDLLAESRAEIRQGADPALLEKHRALQQRLNAKDIAWRQCLDSRNAADQTEAMAKEIDSLAGDLQMVELQIRAGSPRYSALVQPQPLSTAEVQQMLDENTVILEFALGETQSWVWAVTRDSLQSFKLPPRAEIEAAARNAYELLTERRPKKGLTEDERLKLVAEADAKLQTAMAALSRTLLCPISAQLQQEWKGRRLAVVASGALEYLPFAALPAPESGRAGEQESGRQGDKETRRQGGDIN